jgi:nucleoid-associated protein YgaU
MKRFLRSGLVAVSFSMAGHLHAGDASASPDEVSSLRADNKQLSDELAAAWKESEKLKADLAAAQKSGDQVADLQKQLDAAKASGTTGGDASQLADLQDKLATALRSFSVVQDENNELKASIEKLTTQNAMLSQQLDIAHSSIASLQTEAAKTSEIDPLRTQVRNAQDEISRLATENADLRTRLSLQSPGPGAGKPAPLRPGTPSAVAAEVPPAPTPTPTPETKTYVVVEGDTLTKISRKFYGSSNRWDEILKANHDTLKDENSLVVGSTLKIP